MNIRNIKKQSSEKCKVNSRKLALITLLYLLIITAVESIGLIKLGFNNLTTTISSIGLLLIYGALVYGFSSVIKLNYNGVEPNVNNLFYGFKVYAKTLVLYLIEMIYVFLWSLLFVIPGIIKAISYSMAFYIAIDNPNMSAQECLSRSQEMMNGHKWEYFCLMLSYIGWIILSSLTLGILSLWVIPKINTSTYIFYLEINK